MREGSPEQQEFPPLDIKTRSLFQVELMRAMGVERHNHQAQSEWVEKYAKPVSDLIDNDPDIRPLLEDKAKWLEAREKVIKRIEQ